MLYKWPHKSHTGPFLMLTFLTSPHSDIEMGGKTLSETNICRECFKNLPTHLLYLPWGRFSSIGSKKILSHPKEYPLCTFCWPVLSETIHDTGWFLVHSLQKKQETGFCFITAQTFLLQFFSQNPYMFNMLSGISPLNPKWMFYDVQRTILWISKFPLLPYICILFKAGVK